jgi:hypothetical protein
MSLADSDPSVVSQIVPVAAVVFLLLVLAGLAHVYIHANGAPQRKIALAFMLATSSAIVLAGLYALSPDSIAFFPAIGIFLFLASLFIYFARRSCKHCGRAVRIDGVTYDFTNCPYCGNSYEE